MLAIVWCTPFKICFQGEGEGQKVVVHPSWVSLGQISLETPSL